MAFKDNPIYEYSLSPKIYTTISMLQLYKIEPSSYVPIVFLRLKF
jgi:hypothetical protein